MSCGKLWWHDIKEVGQKYGARSYFSVSKTVSRFRQRLAKDHTLKVKFKKYFVNVDSAEKPLHKKNPG